jgi:hypothetical protein
MTNNSPRLTNSPLLRFTVCAAISAAEGLYITMVLAKLIILAAAAFQEFHRRFDDLNHPLAIT